MNNKKLVLFRFVSTIISILYCFFYSGVFVKIISILSCILFCLSTELMTMEITHMLKLTEDTSLIKCDKHNQYNQLTVIDSRISLAEEIGYSLSWTHHISQLPKEIRAIIYQHLFNANETMAKNLAAIETKAVLNPFYEVQPYCPIVMGNKTFTVSGLLAMTRTTRKKLMRIDNNDISTADISTIKDLPVYMKEGLEVIIASTMSEDCSSGPLAWCCGCGLCASGCLSAIMPCCIGGCHASPLWWFPGGTFLACSVALPLAWKILNCLPCSKGQTVYIFSAKKA